MLWFGALSTRMPLQRLVLLGPLFGIAYFAIASVVGQVWQLGAAQVLNACFIGIIQGLAISYVQEFLPSQPGRASTLYSNTFACGMILSSPLLGIGREVRLPRQLHRCDRTRRCRAHPPCRWAPGAVCQLWRESCGLTGWT